MVHVNIHDTTVGENQGTARFLVTLSAPSDQTVSVQYDDFPGSASVNFPGEDYIGFLSSVLTFAPGETEKEIAVPVVSDTAPELTEAFSVVLRNPVGGAVGRSEGVAAIIDDDGAARPEPTLIVEPVFVGESAGHADFVLRLDGPSAAPVSLRYATVNGTAVANEDYAPATGSVLFAPGEVVKTVRVAIANDANPEAMELFSLRLDNVAGAEAPRSLISAVIADDDGPRSDQPVIDISDVVVAEGAGIATLRVSLSAPSDQAVSVTYDDLPGSAGANNPGADYTSFLSRTLGFAPGEMHKDITVMLEPDALAEGDEAFTLVLRNASGATIGDGMGQVLILDDDTADPADGPIYASIVGSATLRVTESPFGRLVEVPVRLSRPAEAFLSVPVAVRADSTLSAEEYALSVDTLVFAPGEIVATLQVFINDDAWWEPAETLRLDFDLSAEPALFDAPLSAEITVIDNDPRPAVTEGPDALTGTEANDFLDGLGGNDTIDGRAGNDVLRGGAGDDTLRGGDGADTLNGGDGDDIIFGGETDADLRDVIFGGLGHDRIDAGHGNDQVYGGDGDDTVEGGFGVDEIIGQGGNDVLTGSAFSDLIFGGDGDDFVNGGFGSDRVNGGAGADQFYHLGIADHGSDWVQDYSAAEGDRLVWGGGAATRAQFQVNLTETAGAGAAGVDEAFVIYRPTGQILWALVDGGAQGAINLQIGGQVFDLLG
jgi:Ca2+-binding RTX toxin-like protein